MPSRKEIQWSQLKVGLLVLAAMAVLIGLIFLMNGASGGLFGHKRVLRAYFANAAGLKDGAVVSLDGVTVGNVLKTRVVPERNPYPVEITMRVGDRFWPFIHTDSTARVAPAGVLGDSFVDIDSRHASGPQPANNAELAVSGSPTIAQVISSSQLTIEEINLLMRKIDFLDGELTAAEHLLDRRRTGARELGIVGGLRAAGVAGIDIDEAVAEDACRGHAGRRIGVDERPESVAHPHSDFDRIGVAFGDHAGLEHIAYGHAVERDDRAVFQAGGIGEVGAENTLVTEQAAAGAVHEENQTDQHGHGGQHQQSNLQL